MKMKIMSIFLVMSLLVTSNATASFFTTVIPTTTDIVHLISKLSDDIGIMADRILDMADEIGEMADKIGVMSDRIVHTEEMMADLTLQLATLNTDTATSPTVIISNETQNVLDASDVPIFTSNTTSTQTLVYVSSSMTMDTNTVSVLVNSNEDLASKWSELKGLARENKIYLAIKSIDGNSISSLSNVLTYTTLY